MSNRPKKLSSWEEQFAVIFTGKDTDLEEKLTEEEFLERFADTEKYPRTGVDHKVRTAWLKYNGYEVNRQTMIEDLPTVKLPKELLIDNAPE